MNSTDILYSVSPVIGISLSFDDRCAMSLTHPCFEAVHTSFEYHVWNLSCWKAEDIADVEIWNKKVFALAHRKPNIKLLELNLDIKNLKILDQKLEENSLRNMFNLFFAPSLVFHQLHTIEISISPPTKEFMDSFVNSLKISELYLHGVARTKLIIKFNLDSASCLLLSLFDALQRLMILKNNHVNVSVHINIHEGYPHISDYFWRLLSSQSVIIEKVSHDDHFYLHGQISKTGLEALQTIPEIVIMNTSLLQRTEDKRFFVESATTLIDPLCLTACVLPIEHIQFISTHLKRLKRYIVGVLSSDIFCMSPDYVANEFIKALDASSIQEFCLANRSLLNPSVIPFIKYMLQKKKRKTLSINILVYKTDMYSRFILCAELIRRHIPGICVESDDIYTQKCKQLSYDDLIRELNKVSPELASVWSMIKPVDY